MGYFYTAETKKKLEKLKSDSHFLENSSIINDDINNIEEMEVWVYNLMNGLPGEDTTSIINKEWRNDIN